MGLGWCINLVGVRVVEYLVCTETAPSWEEEKSKGFPDSC